MDDIVPILKKGAKNDDDDELLTLFELFGQRTGELNRLFTLHDLE